MNSKNSLRFNIFRLVLHCSIIYGGASLNDFLACVQWDVLRGVEKNVAIAQFHEMLYAGVHILLLLENYKISNYPTWFIRQLKKFIRVKKEKFMKYLNFAEELLILSSSPY